MIGMTSGCADTPRAHITNPAGLECLRDIGLEDECIRNASNGDFMQHTRWGYSMSGEEYARIYAWGNDPKRRGDYDAATPCSHVDCPQTMLEPILIRYATLHGWICRWNSKFLSFERRPEGRIVSRIHDEVTGADYSISSKYLFGCNGSKSQIVKDLGIRMIKQPGQGRAINVLARVDLSQHLASRAGSLHWNIQPDMDHPDWAWACIARMVKPWHEWMFLFLPAPGSDLKSNPGADDYLKQVRHMVGDPSLSVEILDVAGWYINEIVAESYSRDNIFCLGDAVHRHPPTNGLGSNTCIQDAFNLAWKVAYVEKGLGTRTLLSTYSRERQPVGAAIVARANQGLREHVPVWDAMGLLAPTPGERSARLAELGAATPAGKARREKLRTAIERTAREFHGLGIEMNQHYASAAVATSDEIGPRPGLLADPVLQHQITTYPGSRLPHAWLNTRCPGKQFSTIDLAGHGVFCLLTGIGGEAWKEAAKMVGKELGVEIRAYAIGWGQDYEDVYFDWERRREICEEGCVLVRPDRFVAWRSMSMVDDCVGKLKQVMKNICIGSHCEVDKFITLSHD